MGYVWVMICLMGWDGPLGSLMLSCALEGWLLPVHLDLSFSKLPFLNEQALVPPLHHLASVGVCACLLCVCRALVARSSRGNSGRGYYEYGTQLVL